MIDEQPKVLNLYQQIDGIHIEGLIPNFYHHKSTYTGSGLTASLAAYARRYTTVVEANCTRFVFAVLNLKT